MLPIEIWALIAGQDESVYHVVVRAIKGVTDNWPITAQDEDGQRTPCNWKDYFTVKIQGLRVTKWELCGKLHREGDLPAFICDRPKDIDLPSRGAIRRGYQHNHQDKKYSGCNQVWYKHGKCHRGHDLPAVQCATYDYEWYVEGEPHRDNDMPAVCNADGHKEWFVRNKLHRDNDLPAIIWADGTQSWYCQGVQHRDNDLPAVISEEYIEWLVNGLRHRDNDLPAVVCPQNGYCEWWYQGEFRRSKYSGVAGIQDYVKISRT